jgi:hypothetical protein
MKSPIAVGPTLALVIAAGAFAASTIYLGVQLREERERAAEVLAQSRALEARVAELEKARTTLATAQDDASKPEDGP